jgi:hypothetical protein
VSAKGKLYTHLKRWRLYHRQDLGSVNPQPATSSKGIGFWILIVLGILLALFIALSLASAAERLDVFDLVFALVAQKPKGNSVNILASLACFARELQCPGSASGTLWVRLQPLLRPYPAEEMTAYPVSTVVNSPRNDAPSCIQPLRQD